MVKLQMVNISGTDEYGNTALHICCQKDFIDIKRDIVDLLLNHNIKIDIRNNLGKLPTDLLRPNDPRLKIINNRIRKGNKFFVQQSTRLNDEKPHKRMSQSHTDEKAHGRGRKVV